MINIFKKIYQILSIKERKQIYWLLFAILVMGLLETMGIASIMPFLAVLSNPEIIHTNKLLSHIYIISESTSQTQFLFYLGIGVLMVLVLSNSFSAFTTWLLFRFTYFQGHNLSCRLFQRYLDSPYSFFLNHNSSELIKNIITEVHRFSVGVLTSATQIISRVIIALCIIGLLIAMDPLLAIIVFLVCGGSYMAIFMLSKKKLALRGQNTTKTQGERFKLTSEAFGGIKDLKLLGRESHYILRYAEPSHSFAACESTSLAITYLPKYALETIVFGGILLIMLYLIGFKNDINQVLPMLGLYAFAGYRLMPGFNQIFQGSSFMRYHSASLDIIYNHLSQDPTQENCAENNDHPIQPLSFNKNIRLENISFTYPESDTEIIKNFSITIKANSTIAIVGTTGSGKTTLIDIILGLLPISSGHFYIDNELICSGNIRSWQQNIGYVSQNIYLADDSVTRNIALGVPDEEVDFDAIKKAATLANIDDFISNDLPQGYNTNLGERGVRLSGGQRQRIGIARALYHDPKVLVFDEATSALDGVTENAIMDAIGNLSHKKTIIMIAHRITTVKESDSIYLMGKEGEILANGTYENLIASNEQFRALASSSKLPKS